MEDFFMRRDTFIYMRSKAFALRIIKLYRFLIDEKKEFVLSKQIMRSGTSIGANIREAIRAQSTADFIAKLYISLKEAEETMFWLELLEDSEYVESSQIANLYEENNELVIIITKSISSAKNKLQIAND